MNSATTWYSERQPNTLDVSSRIAKAQKIISVLTHYYLLPGMSSCNCLDIGSSTGIISRSLGREFSSVIGIDVDKKGLYYASEHNLTNNVMFVEGSGCKLPFDDETFDVVICNHVYEHVPNARELIADAHRILRPGGICYLACTNKYWIIEPHYDLPFLSWLPRRLSNFYLRITRRGVNYEEQLLSRTEVLSMLGQFKVTEYTLKILMTPGDFCASDVYAKWGFSQYVPLWLAKSLIFWMPNFVWVLEKKGARVRIS